MDAITINVGSEDATKKIVQFLKTIIKTQENQMATIQELSSKIDALQSSIDSEQIQIKAALDGLTAANEELKVLIVDGGTEAERAAVASKLDAAIADLSSTIPDAPVEGGTEGGPDGPVTE